VSATTTFIFTTILLLQGLHTVSIKVVERNDPYHAGTVLLVLKLFAINSQVCVCLCVYIGCLCGCASVFVYVR
jgi:hypothetical protein